MLAERTESIAARRAAHALALVVAMFVAGCPAGPDESRDLGGTDTSDGVDAAHVDMDTGGDSGSCATAADGDGDGHDAVACGGDDCDDDDRNRFPGRTEVCDTMQHDEDCDPSTFGFRDADGDGVADAACCNEDPAGGADICGTDCNDVAPGIHPTANEVCNSLDDDCDTATDEDVLNTYYPDGDGDNYGVVGGTAVMACFRPTDYADNDRDCDDMASGVNPGVGEQCDAAMVDENCDGIINPPEDCICTIGASRPCTAPGACAMGTEQCLDGSWGSCSIGPVTEMCNGIDDNCSGVADEGLTVTCFDDLDNDGYPAGGAQAVDRCPDISRPSVGGCPTFTTNRIPMGATLDCADDDGGRRPGASETCNGVDDNCDGTIDEGLRIVCHTDADNDTYAPGTAATTNECPAPDRAAVGGCPLFMTNRAADIGTTDCADMDSARRPSATETCVTGMTAVDDDCDSMVDEGVSATCYLDNDGDSYAASGAAASTQCRNDMRPTFGFCPVGYAGRAPAGITTIDCAPSEPAINPGVAEVCDGASVDEDCDGMANPTSLCMCSGTVTQACPQLGVCGTGLQSCMSGMWSACSISPVTEVCDGLDEDCDGVVDNMLRVSCYADGDNDTYAPAGAPLTTFCPVAGRPTVAGCPVNYTNRAPSAGAIDCLDSNALVRPGGTETCVDGMAALDENCNGTTDEGLRTTCYTDGDNDTYSHSSSSVSRCTDGSPGRAAFGGCPTGFTSRSSTVADDCNDGVTAVNPGASEVCDNQDSNCSSGGGATLNEDGDLDGYAPTAAACTGGYPKTDCDDTRMDTHPGVSEVCDRYDSDCSSGGGMSATDEDGDGDGYASTTAACTSGFLRTDCADNNNLVRPGATTYRTTAYCANGLAVVSCGPLFLDCGTCSAPYTASFDYDCNGSSESQPVGASCSGSCSLGGTCTDHPTGATGGICGQSAEYRDCSCSPCTLVGLVTRPLGCR